MCKVCDQYQVYGSNTREGCECTYVMPPPTVPRRDAMHMFVTQLDVTKDIEESFQPVYKALDAVDRVDEYQRFIAKHRQ